jgi:periplasmic protein TonB
MLNEPLEYLQRPGLTLHTALFGLWPERRRIGFAIGISIVVHSLALSLMPDLRWEPSKAPEVLQVQLSPAPIDRAEPKPPTNARPPAVKTTEPRAPIERKLPTKSAGKLKPSLEPKVAKELEEKPSAPAQPEPDEPEPTVAERLPDPQDRALSLSRPPAPAPPAALAEPAFNEALDGYGQALSRLIAQHQRYPRIARMRGWEGTVQVGIRLAPGERVQQVRIERSSGHDVLDAQALEMVGAALPFPPAPKTLAERDFVVTVPIVFRLKD